MTRSAVIVGYAQRAGSSLAGTNLEDLIFGTVTDALAESGLRRDDVDAVVIAASDQTDGRAISSMLTAGPAGAYLNHEINIASSPGHALAIAYLSILAGLHGRVILASWGKASELVSAGGPAAAERLSADPYYERDVGISPVAALGFQACRHRASSTRGAAAARAVVGKNRANGARDETAALRERVSAEQFDASPLVADPLRAVEVAAAADGAYALLLANERLEGRAPVRIAGVGWSTDRSRLADRDLVGLPHLGAAAARAFEQADIREPRDEIDVCELDDGSADAEVLACDALGIAEGADAQRWILAGGSALDGSMPVNPSGGSLCGEAPFGGGLRKVIAATRQLQGRAAGVQVPGARRALVQIASGFAGQLQTVAVLEGT